MTRNRKQRPRGSADGSWVRLLVSLIAVAAGLLLSLSPLEASDEQCLSRADAKAQLVKLGIPLGQPVNFQQSSFSSFKGVTLTSTVGEAVTALFGEGFNICIHTYVSSSDHISTINICRPHIVKPVGSLQFDYQGRLSRLDLRVGYFFEKEIGVREFADRVFRHYHVHPTEVADDACFQDVTCFRGWTDAGERFLILKIDGETELYVQPKKPGS